MPKIIETVVYTIDELSDDAKEAARSWYRQIGLHDEWYDFVYDDFERICGILGIALRTSPVKLGGGDTRDKSHIYFRGFGSQGDGASFEGSCCHAKGAARAIRAHAPQDTELHRIADVLRDAQRRNFFQLHGAIRQRGGATRSGAASGSSARTNMRVSAGCCSRPKRKARSWPRRSRRCGCCC